MTTPQEIEILKAMPGNLSYLAKATNRDTSNIRRSLKVMEEKGWIRRDWMNKEYFRLDAGNLIINGAGDKKAEVTPFEWFKTDAGTYVIRDQWYEDLIIDVEKAGDLQEGTNDELFKKLDRNEAVATEVLQIIYTLKQRLKSDD